MSVPEAGNAIGKTLYARSSSPRATESPFSTASGEEKAKEVQRHKSSNDDAVIDWDGPNDPANPKNFTRARKWLITGAALLGTLLIPVNGTSIAVAAVPITGQFGISDEHFANSYWTITSWSVGGAIFVIVGLPLVEDLGVRLGFLSFYAFFILMIIPQALAQNFETLVITRFFSGGAVTLLANIVSSMIPDLFESDADRSLPVGLWILVYLIGNTAGPPMFAGVVQYIGDWRWIFYIQLIMYGALFPVFWFCIRETRANVILEKRAKAFRKNTGRRASAASSVNRVPVLKRLRQAVVRPFFLEATEPVLSTCTVWSAFCVGTVYMFTQSVEQVFAGIYGWNTYNCAYVQSAVIIGEILGWIISFYGTRLYLKSAARNDEMPGRPIPEARLYVSIFGSFIGLAGGMFVYAWTSYPSIHWIAPAIGLAMVGVGIQINISALADYIVDAYAESGYAGSAVSGIAAAENIMSAFLPLATLSMYRELGYHWASSILGFIGLVLSFAPVIFVWKGRRFRERSPFMLSAGQSWKDKIEE